MISNVFTAIEPFKNKVNIQTDSIHNNDWNDSDTGKNNAASVDIDQTTAQDIGINGEKNKLTTDINVTHFKNVTKMTLEIIMQKVLIEAKIFLKQLMFSSVIITTSISI